MHALVFRAHSHIQPCTMRHPTPFSQLRRFQQPFFQRARSLPPLQMPAPSLASKKQRHRRCARAQHSCLRRCPCSPPKSQACRHCASSKQAGCSGRGRGSNSVLKHVRVACSAFRSVCCNDWTGKTSVHFLLVWCVVDTEKNPPAPPTGLDPRPERSCCKSKGFSGAGALSKVKFTLRANVTHTPQFTPTLRMSFCNVAQIAAHVAAISETSAIARRWQQ